jgi:CNT family concentrative nucleoside transporter
MDFIIDLLRGGLGIAVMIAVCYLLSNDRSAINWRLVLGGLALQIVLALLILKVPMIYAFFNFIADSFVALLGYAEAGATFLFGAWPAEAYIQSTNFETGLQVPFQLGYMFAFKVLPTIIFFSAFSAILYYLGILQVIIYGFAKVMSKVMALSGAESLAAAANVFIGQTEAPLVIKPFLEDMTRSEIMCLMTGGMATIAGGVFALFVSIIGDEYAIHFLTASIISAPAAIVAAKIMYPETEPEKTNDNLEIPKDKIGNNLLDAISIGTTDGVKLAVNVGAMLLVFISLVALVNGALYFFADLIVLDNLMVDGESVKFTLNDKINQLTNGRFEGFNLEYILGLVFAPIAWLLGVDSADITLVGQLLGKKTVINEVIGYVDLQALMGNPDINLSPKSVIIATYALCGFSNFSSIGIQIGGISSLAPNQRPTLTELGVKALIGGTIACFITGAIAGVLV